MHRVRLIISGFVQGVGFRSWVKRHALRIPVAGWVKNRDDGAVETLAEGEKDRLTTFIALCRKGPEVSDVTDVTIDWSDATGEFRGFEVIY